MITEGIYVNMLHGFYIILHLQDWILHFIKSRFYIILQIQNWILPHFTPTRVDFTSLCTHNSGFYIILNPEWILHLKGWISHQFTPRRVDFT